METNENNEVDDAAPPGCDVDLIRKLAATQKGEQAFHELFVGSPPASPVALVLLQKAASAEDQELLGLAVHLNPEAPLELYEELGGTYKLGAPGDKAKGLGRVAQLLTGSRIKSLSKAKDEAAGEAGKSLLKAVDKTRHDWPSHAQQNIRHADRAEGIGRVLSKEEDHVRQARTTAAKGVGVAGVAAGLAVATHKHKSNNK